MPIKSKVCKNAIIVRLTDVVAANRNEGLSSDVAVGLVIGEINVRHKTILHPDYRPVQRNPNMWTCYPGVTSGAGNRKISGEPGEGPKPLPLGQTVTRDFAASKAS